MLTLLEVALSGKVVNDKPDILRGNLQHRQHRQPLNIRLQFLHVVRLRHVHRLGCQWRAEEQGCL